MRRTILTIATLCSAASLSAQPPLAVSEGIGPRKVTLDRYDRPPPTPYSVVSIDTSGGAVALDQVGPAVGRLLGRSIALKPLPADVTVQFGAVRGSFEAALRRRLRQPGANWNPATGRPRKGAYYAVLTAILAAVIADSPIAAAFRQNGYRLQLDGIARVTEDPAPRGSDHLPAHIDEMHVSAHKERR